MTSVSDDEASACIMPNDPLWYTLSPIEQAKIKMAICRPVKPKSKRKKNRKKGNLRDVTSK